MTRALALAALLAACKADLHHTTDANMPVVPGDTLSQNIGDPPATAVRLTVTRLGLPVSDVAVVFQAADSAVAGAVLTNEQGLAWAEVPPGGYVTAIEHTGSGVDELSTFSGVAPGDALALEVDPTGPRAETTFALSFPDAGAPAYAVYTPCGSTTVASTNVSFNVIGCDGVVDFIILPLDADGNPTGTSLYAPGVSLVAAVVTLTGTYEPLAATTFAYSNVPAAWQFIGLYHAISAERRAYEQSSGMTPAGTVASTQLAIPSSTASTLTVTTQYPVADELGQQRIYSWQPAQTSYAIDIGASQLAPYTAVATYDLPSRTVSWSEGTGQTPDLVRSRLRVYRDDIPSGRAWSWRLAAPRTATHVTYPQLPVLGFDFNPQASDSLSVDELTAIQAPGGYAALRAHAFGDPMRAISGAAGHMLIQTAFSPAL